MCLNNLKHSIVGYANALTHPDTNGESEWGINKNLDLCVKGKLQANLLYVLGNNWEHVVYGWTSYNMRIWKDLMMCLYLGPLDCSAWYGDDVHLWWPMMFWLLVSFGRIISWCRLDDSDTWWSPCIVHKVYGTHCSVLHPLGQEPCWLVLLSI